MQTNKWFYIMGAVVCVAMFWAIAVRDTEDQKTARFDKCVEAVQKAIPDSNDNSRASFLKDCYQN